MNTTKQQEIREQIAGELKLPHTTQYITDYFISLLHSEQIALLKELRDECDGRKRKHVIDMELYHDSGGGEMCEVCGKQGTELDEPCDRNNDWNSALTLLTASIDEKIKSLSK